MAYIPPPTSVMGLNPYSDSDKCIRCPLGIILEKEIRQSGTALEKMSSPQASGEAKCCSDIPRQFSTFGNVWQAQFARPSALSRKVRMKTKISQVILLWTYNNEEIIIALINATTWGTTKWQNWKGLCSPAVIKEEPIQTVVIWVLFVR